MEMLVKKDGGTLYASLGGEIDHHEAEGIRQRLDGHILEERPDKLVFDFSRVRFMDSSGIGLVLGRYRLMSSMGGKTVIRGASENIEKIFKMSGLNRMIEII